MHGEELRERVLELLAEDTDTLEGIANQVGVTRERVRQIRVGAAIPPSQRITQETREKAVLAADLVRVGASVSTALDAAGITWLTVKNYVGAEEWQAAKRDGARSFETHRAAWSEYHRIQSQTIYDLFGLGTEPTRSCSRSTSDIRGERSDAQLST